MGHIDLKCPLSCFVGETFVAERAKGRVVLRWELRRASGLQKERTSNPSGDLVEPQAYEDVSSQSVLRHVLEKQLADAILLLHTQNALNCVQLLIMMKDTLT